MISRWLAAIAPLMIACACSCGLGAASDSATPLSDSDDANASLTATSAPADRSFFDLSGSRSSYGRDFFHDPLLGPDFDAESQIEIEYSHIQSPARSADEIEGQLDWNPIGQLTFEAEFGWQFGLDLDDEPEDAQPSGNGFENVDLAAYFPLIHLVSAGGALDYSPVFRLDVGIPTSGAPTGNDVRLTPYLAHLLRIGQHVSLEAWTGFRFTIAPEQTTQCVYGVSMGYLFFPDQIPMPGIENFIPILEMDGKAALSGSSMNAVFGVVGFSTNFKPIGQIGPSLEIGYQFPLDSAVRELARWGVTVQIAVDF